MRFAIIAVTLLASASAADATCAFVRLGPRVLTTRSTALPPDGGVLVGYQANGGAAAPDDPSAATDWTASDGGKQPVAMTRVALAPGLSLFKLAGDKPTKITTKDGKTPIGAFTHDPKAAAAALPAPQPTAAKTTHTQGFRSTNTTSTITLAKAPPPEAVAIIVYDNATPITYAQLPDTHDTLTSIDVYAAGGHCALPVPGQALGAGSYTLAYVDAFGRVSPHSKPVKGKS